MARPANFPLTSLIRSLGSAGPETGSVLAQVLRAIVTDVLAAIGGSIAAGSVARGPVRPGLSARLACRLLVKRLLGNAECVYGGGHPAVENHLGDDLGDLLFADADVKRAGDVPLDHLGAVSQDHQGRNGAQAAGAQIDRGAVVDLPVYDLVHQLHHLRSKLHHCGGRLRVVVRAVVEHPEFGRSLLQVYFLNGYFVPLDLFFLRIAVSGFRFFVLVQGAIGTKIRVFVVILSGHCVHTLLGSHLHPILKGRGPIIPTECASSGGLPS